MRTVEELCTRREEISAWHDDLLEVVDGLDDLDGMSCPSESLGGRRARARAETESMIEWCEGYLLEIDERLAILRLDEALAPLEDRIVRLRDEISGDDAPSTPF